MKQLRTARLQGWSREKSLTSRKIDEVREMEHELGSDLKAAGVMKRSCWVLGGGWVVVNSPQSFALLVHNIIVIIILGICCFRYAVKAARLANA